MRARYGHAPRPLLASFRCLLPLPHRLLPSYPPTDLSPSPRRAQDRRGYGDADGNGNDNGAEVPAAVDAGDAGGD